MNIIDDLRSYRVTTDCASWHPPICDRAAGYITDLLARAEEAEARAEKAERERDAAVRQLASLEICGYCKNGQCTTRGGTKECKFDWNGGQKEE